jgi:death-on-curing protein
VGVTNFLTAAQIIDLHAVMLERYGGAVGGGHRGAGYEGVEAAAQAVMNAYYTKLEELAAAYAIYIVQGHVFMDGNKRSGAGALALFLRMNGVKPKLSWKRLKGVMVELQTRSEAGEDTGQLVEWLANML